MTEGKKFDSAKTRWELVPWAEMKEVAEIMSFGAEKYGERSWTNLPNAKDRYTGALIRHLMAWIEGEQKDAESGKNHLAHVICNALFLINNDNKGDK